MRARPCVVLLLGTLVVIACARAPTSAPPRPRASASDLRERTTVLRVDDPGRAIALDERPPGLQRTPREWSALLSGAHARDYRRTRWWLIEDPADAGGTLQLSIGPATAARLAGSDLLLNVRVSLLFDGLAAPLEHDTEVRVPARGEPFLHATFATGALPDSWRAPPAIDPARPEPLTLAAWFEGGAWRGILSSLRADVTCNVLEFPRREPSPCDDYPGLLVLEHDRQRRVDLNAALEPGFTPLRAVEALRDLHALRVRWPDGASSPLQLSVVPRGFACVAAGNVPTLASRMHGKLVPGLRVVIPLTLGVRTEDERLHAELDGMIETYVARGVAWEGGLEADSMLTTTDTIVSAGGRAGIATRRDRLTLLHFSVHMPQEGAPPSQIRWTAYAPFPGVPAFPVARELSSNRVSCFGALRLRESVEAAIERGADAAPAGPAQGPHHGHGP